jgi:probable biosynthetic protein (TIGR04098 family)
MHAGHMHWSAIATAIGEPLSRLRTVDDGPVYATFYFIELDVPEHAPMDSFRLDDVLRFRSALRASKRMVVEGQFIFDHAERLPASADAATPAQIAAARGRHPYLRFANIFITPERGNSRLRVAPPANGDFSHLPPFANEDNPYVLNRAAATSGELGLIDERWQPLVVEDAETIYAIDPDRDSNGAGLVYFANFVSFMDAAERVIGGRATHPALDPAVGRTVCHRRIAFYGNASLTDVIRTRVTWFYDPARAPLLALRYALHREEDDQLICLSEAIKRPLRERG